LAVIRIASPLQVIEAPTFLKSYRCPDLLGRLVQRVVDLLTVHLAHDVERGLRSHVSSLFVGRS